LLITISICTYEVCKLQSSSLTGSALTYEEQSNGNW
jgi:hypothetical protein